MNTTWGEKSRWLDGVFQTLYREYGDDPEKRDWLMLNEPILRDTEGIKNVNERLSLVLEGLEDIY